MKTKIEIKSHLVFIILSLFLSAFSCSNDPLIPKPEAKLMLSVEDVSCIEAWLNLKLENVTLPVNIELKSDTSILKTFTSIKSLDTVLFVDSLLPNKTYSIQAFIHSTNHSELSSNELSVTTMDTTSHNFSCEVFTIGNEIYSSNLYDVAIIGSEIWVVGEIMIADTSITGYKRYSYMKWNGENWEMRALNYFPPGSVGDSITTAGRSIFAFNENDLWISGGAVFHWDGLNWNTFYNTGAEGANKIWGTNSNDLYFVGNSGSITHYNGSQWRKIESGADISLKDIYGTPNGKEIWTCGWNYQTGQSMILKITNNTSEIIWNSEIPDPNFVYSGLINSICANGNNEFVFVGGQVYRQSLFGGRLARREWVKTSNGSQVLVLGNYGYRIKGSNKNNISVAGDAAMIWHFNGSTWYKFSELHNEEDRLYGLAVSENLIIAVGKRYAPNTLGVGLIIIGRR